MKQRDPFQRLVPSWNVLRYLAIPDVGVGLNVVGAWDVLVAALDSGALPIV